MAPRQRNANEVKSQTNVLHMLNAIQPKLGELPTKTVQEELAQQVCNEEGLDLTGIKLRERLFAAISREPARSGQTKGAEIFTKPASEVLSRGYLDLIGFKTSISADQRPTRASDEPKQKPKVKLNIPASRLPKTSTVQTNISENRHLPKISGNVAPFSAAGTKEAAEQQPAVNGSDEKFVGGTPAKHPSSLLHRSQSSDGDFQHVEIGTNRLHASVDIVADASSITSLLDTTVHGRATKAQHSAKDQDREKQAVEGDGAHVVNEHALAETLQDEQLANEARNPIEAADHIIEKLQGQLKQSQQNEVALKQRIDEIEAQAMSSSDKKRSSSSPEPPAKRCKSAAAAIQEERCREISKKMIDLHTGLHDLVCSYYYSRNLSQDTWAEYVASPSPALESLYSQICHSSMGDGWRSAEIRTQVLAYRVVMRLIAAHVYHFVFRQSLPWSESGTAETMSALQQFLPKNSMDRFNRDSAFRRANDKDFHDIESAKYAEELAGIVSIIIGPHLDRVMKGRARSTCDEWFKGLVELYRGVLAIRATIDTYEGEIEAFWPSNGSKMDPLMEDPPNMANKHRPQKLYGVEWPGLKWKVGSGTEVILVRAQVAAGLIPDA